MNNSKMAKESFITFEKKKVAFFFPPRMENDDKQTRNIKELAKFL